MQYSHYGVLMQCVQYRVIIFNSWRSEIETLKMLHSAARHNVKKILQVTDVRERTSRRFSATMLNVRHGQSFTARKDESVGQWQVIQWIQFWPIQLTVSNYQPNEPSCYNYVWLEGPLQRQPKQKTFGRQFSPIPSQTLTFVTKEIFIQDILNVFHKSAMRSDPGTWVNH